MLKNINKSCCSKTLHSYVLVRKKSFIAFFGKKKQSDSVMLLCKLVKVKQSDRSGKRMKGWFLSFFTDEFLNGFDSLSSSEQQLFDTLKMFSW